METTTLLMLAPLAPLAFGLACAYMAAHFAHVRTVPTPAYTAAEFERAFDRYVEDRFNEGNPDYKSEEL
jgi:hypothetical protein